MNSATTRLPQANVLACQKLDGEADWFPPVDILADVQEYLFKIDLPDVKSDDIRVVVERDGLFISGHRPSRWQENRKYLRVERPRGYFERCFALPGDASRVEIDSVFNQSVLELHVRKVSPFAPGHDAIPAPPKLKLRTPS